MRPRGWQEPAAGWHIQMQLATLKFIHHTVSKRPRTKDQGMLAGAATGTGLGADISGFRGQVLPQVSLSHQHTSSSCTGKTQRVSYSSLSRESPPTFQCLPRCVIISPTCLMHSTRAQADGNEAGRSWWQCTCGHLLSPQRPSTESPPNAQGTLLCRVD